MKSLKLISIVLAGALLVLCSCKKSDADTAISGWAETSDGTKVQWVQLCEGGAKWAVYNVGAKSISDVGGYYCWGGSVDKDKNGVYSSSTQNIQGTADDTAKKLWGNNWQMPTKDDLILLLVAPDCNRVWKSAEESGYGVAGLLITGTGKYSENSLFFPAAGQFLTSSAKVENLGELGRVWSSDIGEHVGVTASALQFTESLPGSFSAYENPSNGFTVRAILK